jgi:Fur family transcriptional regulator, ferric uptake regulator
VRPAAEVLADAGLRSTRQRAEIVGFLADSPRPVTAQGLHAALNPEGRGGPGLATVYRTLQAVAGAGLARTFPTGDGEVAYRLCEPGHHHHLVCERCGAVVEIPSCEVEDWATQVASKRGFVVMSHQADVYGLCSACA